MIPLVLIDVKLFASLTDYLPAAARKGQTLSMQIDGPAAVEDVIRLMNLPDDMVHLVLLNGVYVEPAARGSTHLTEGDSVAIWPPVAGG